LSETPIRIIVATDLSENGKKAEDYALSIAQRLSAEVILVHSLLAGFHPVIGPAFSSGTAQKDYQDMIQKLRPKILEDLEVKVKKFKKFGIRCFSSIDETSLTASGAILRQIKKTKPSFIIMGTHGRSLFSGAFLGSTAREMILNSSVPVMIIKSRL
jgi:nucleotide-binding universal stress UspA family protein